MSGVTLEIQNSYHAHTASNIELIAVAPENVVHEIATAITNSHELLEHAIQLDALIAKYESLNKALNSDDVKSIIESANTKESFLPKGFKINSIERVLAYVSIIGVIVAACATISSQKPVVINNIYDLSQSKYEINVKHFNEASN